ncbi:Retrovirus-related Pol polyprotein from transposon TNT 1-94 [Eumeta japonica]|uniref:Retrovirus-related Pol polyprotein from transposon TNT 1-94 n=1 Tax=Eumeta variegata TaxID=151549 RepID=A0A4C1W4K3_EUMVA|nr:Retrovirus-related Pol polyprotein from transposon TNT 1-94 [Eumeta japonica]
MDSTQGGSGQQNVMKLEGSRNWNVWKFQTSVLLRGQGLYKIVDGTTVKPEDDTQRSTWETQDARAQTLIVTRMTEEVMLHIISCDTAAAMWRKLLSVYEQKSETSIHIVQQRFFQFKFEEGTEMFLCPPEDYKHFISAWESAPDDKQTYDNLVARLLIEEERIKEANAVTAFWQRKKIHRLPYPVSNNVTSRVCEIIHADTCGPMEKPSIGGSRYFVVFKDEYSKYRRVFFVKTKDEIKSCIKNFISQAENETGNKIKIFRSDNGTEFINKEVREVFQNKGIIHQTSVTFTPEQNGVAERENRILVEAARTMLYAKDLPISLWAESVNTAAYKSEVETKRDIVFVNNSPVKPIQQCETINYIEDSVEVPATVEVGAQVEDTSAAGMSSPQSPTMDGDDSQRTMQSDSEGSVYEPSDSDECGEVVRRDVDPKNKRIRKQTVFYNCNNVILVYKCDDSNLVGFCDADWEGDLRDRKSTTGYCFMYSNCLISWCSKKQSTVSLSSAESEYVAMSMAGNMILPFIKASKAPFNVSSPFVARLSNNNDPVLKINTQYNKSDFPSGSVGADRAKSLVRYKNVSVSIMIPITVTRASNYGCPRINASPSSSESANDRCNHERPLPASDPRNRRSGGACDFPELSP